MADITFAACDRCESEGNVQLPVPGALGPLVCLNCASLISAISVEPWHDHIEHRVAEFEARHRAGTLGSRKQAIGQSDSDIDRDGLQAELSACLLLCPGMRQRWVETSGPNRGNDLPPGWTGLPKPVEVKQTRYCDDRRGCLIVRPPRNTPGAMRPEYIDDSLYILLFGQNGLFTLLGWADRDHLLRAGQLNPIPVRPGQRECWGMHWRRLLPPNSLLDQVPRSTWRWTA